jgi:hypothetical protein
MFNVYIELWIISNDLETGKKYIVSLQEEQFEPPLVNYTKDGPDIDGILHPLLHIDTQWITLSPKRIYHQNEDLYIICHGQIPFTVMPSDAFWIEFIPAKHIRILNEST